MKSASTQRSAFRAMVTTAVLSASVILASGCNKEESAAAAGGAAQARQASPVSVAKAIARDVPIYLDEIGKMVSIESVSLTPQVGGKILAAHIEDGAYVKKGQLLYEIDPAPFEAALAAAKAQLAQSQAEFIWAQADFNRTQGLLGENVISQLEFDQKKSALGVAEARVAGAEAAVQAADLNLTYTKIYSPIDGRAGIRLIVPGNVVKANEGSLLSIQRLDPIYAEFTVNENDLGTVRKFMSQRGMAIADESTMNLKVLVDVPGDSARVISAIGNPNAPASTQPTTRGTQPREGVLTFLDNTVQNGTGTVKLRATVPNGDRFFWPGQFVNVRLVLTTRKDAVLVPVIAQQISQQGPFVYVVKPDNTAEMRVIRAGQQQGDLLVIESGVQAGETVITVGQMMVQAGGPVQVLTAEGAAPAGAPQASAAQPTSPQQPTNKPPVDTQQQSGQAGPPQLTETAGSPAGGTGGGATAGGAGH